MDPADPDYKRFFYTVSAPLFEQVLAISAVASPRAGFALNS
jgi:hypothetical protein